MFLTLRIDFGGTITAAVAVTDEGTGQADTVARLMASFRNGDHEAAGRTPSGIQLKGVSSPQLQSMELIPVRIVNAAVTTVPPQFHRLRFARDTRNAATHRCAARTGKLELIPLIQ
jgi:hypothetical protein